MFQASSRCHCTKKHQILCAVAGSISWACWGRPSPSSSSEREWCLLVSLVFGSWCIHGLNGVYTVDPRTKQELGVLTPRAVENPLHNFWLRHHLTTKSLLLTRSLTNNENSQWTHILHAVCIIYNIMIKWAREKKMLLRKTHLQYLLKKKSMSVWTHAVQTCVVQRSTVFN